MSINKKVILLPAITIASLIINVILLSRNCSHKDGEKTTVTNRHRNIPVQPPPPKRSGEPQRLACEYDEDCSFDNICENNKCIAVNGYKDVDAGNLELEETDDLQGPRACTSEADCGCGYECKYDECHKLESTCNVDGDCSTGDFCNKEYHQVCGTCTKSECETDSDCGNGCSDHCLKNHCVQYGCCNNSDCPTDYFCQLFDEAEGSCKQIECYIDSDCGCGFICDQESKSCLGRSTDRPIPCCDGTFYYKEYGSCVGQDLIEDGSCIDNSHCKQGEICSEGEYEDRCLPATCTNNDDCGCGAGCWEGRCELGCNENSACCDKDYPICKHGECINPNPETDDE